jgi:hypothetical protein
MEQKYNIIIKFIFTMIIILSFICLGSYINSKKKLFNSEFWSDWGIYLAHPTKVFSAEMQVPIDRRLLQQPTKCFSCERELLKMDPSKLYLASPSKCFDCEKQILGFNRTRL